MNNLTIDLQNVSDEDKKVLMEIMERSNKPKNKVWKPVEGERAYVLWNNGNILAKLCYNTSSYLTYYEQGNLFPSKDRAEFERERRKIFKRWKDLSIESGELDNPWGTKRSHWYCEYDFIENKIFMVNLHSVKHETTYFATKESINNAIKEIGEENVKKYILGVTE